MKSYSALHIFNDRERILLARAARLVRKVKDPGAENKESPDIIRCHELARAVGKVLDLRYIDGKFGFVDHTWLLTFQKAGDKDNILDVYAVGSLPMVILVNASYLTLSHHKLYTPGRRPRTDIKQDVVDSLVKQMLREFQPRIGDNSNEREG